MLNSEGFFIYLFKSKECLRYLQKLKIKSITYLPLFWQQNVSSNLQSMSAFAYFSSSALTQKQDSVISWGLIYKQETKQNFINYFDAMDELCSVKSKAH